MVCICTFWVCQPEALPRLSHFCILSREAMLQSGTGFTNTVLKRCHQREGKSPNSWLTRQQSRLAPNTLGLGQPLSQKNIEIFALSISKQRNMFVAEIFLSRVVIGFGKHSVSTDDGTWYPQACKFLKLNHHIHSSLEKSLIERAMQYIKDRTECFDDYFPCKKRTANSSMLNNGLICSHIIIIEILSLNFTEPRYHPKVFIFRKPKNPQTRFLSCQFYNFILYDRDQRKRIVQFFFSQVG